MAGVAPGPQPLRTFLSVTNPSRRNPPVSHKKRSMRLDEPLPLAAIEPVLDPAGLRRVEGLGLARCDGGELALTERGRFLGDAVTVALLA